MKELEKIAASVVCNQLALHYNEEIKHTNIYKQKLKNLLNNTIKELQKIELQEFDKVYDENENVTHQISSNLLVFVNEIVKNGFTDMMVLTSMQIAYKKNPKAMEGIINKILNQ